MMILYVIVNRCNGKMYVGQTSKTIRARWVGHQKDARTLRHGMLISRAIHKYGPEAFDIFFASLSITQEQIDRVERNSIISLNTLAPYGYNILRGGNGVRPETRHRMSESHKGYVNSAEHCAKISAARKGIVFTDQHRANIGAASRGRIKGPEELARLSRSLKGKPKSVEHRGKMRNVWLGRKHTAESIEKIRIAALARPKRYGWVPSIETRAKIGEKSRDRRHSQSSRAKISVGLKKHHELRRALLAPNVSSRNGDVVCEA